MEKQGWLVKRGGVRKNWKRRYFSVRETPADAGRIVLRYYTSETVSPKSEIGRFEFAPGTKVLLPGDPESSETLPPDDWAFMVAFPNRDLFLRAESEREMLAWAVILRSVIAAASPSVLTTPTSPEVRACIRVCVRVFVYLVFAAAVHLFVWFLPPPCSHTHTCFSYADRSRKRLF
jgi:hypothetical protein